MNIPSILKTTVTAAALGAATLLTGCAATTAGGGDVVRYKTPGSTFPIAAAVEIPTDARTVYLSGKVPPVVDKSKPATDPTAYGGDTEGQTVAMLFVERESGNAARVFFTPPPGERRGQLRYVDPYTGTVLDSHSSADTSRALPNGFTAHSCLAHSATA